MIIRVITIYIFFATLLIASFQEVKVGKIDEFYKNKITKNQLINIIAEIEHEFETKLRMNIFDYSSSGKPIDIIYLPSSLLEQKINNKIKKLKAKKEKIDKLQNTYIQKQQNIKYLRKELEKDSLLVNTKVTKYNIYVRKLNQKKIESKEQYSHIKKDIQKRKLQLEKETKDFQMKQKKFKKLVSSYNHKRHFYNNIILDVKRLNKEIETMSRNFKKVKGMTFGTKQTNLKIFYKNGKKLREKSVNTNMKKIEIYGFDTIEELKVIIAHEIGHLVGIPHINSKNALMNPILQVNQKIKLSLTKEDVTNFINNF